ncbi:MAG: DUF4286 family protein [Pseudomonadota bacterium]
MSGELVYEVRLSVTDTDPTLLDRWLAEHVEAMLALPGFVDCEVAVPGDDGDGAVRRVTRYRLRDRAALEHYLQHDAAAMRAEGTDFFGERLSSERSVFGLARASSLPQCLNCGTPLTSQYCGECGQRASSRLISLGQLMADALGDVLDVDSRLWRTVRALSFRPGHLTLEYLNGRRASYMPPFRTYLFLSLVFFVLVALLPDGDSDTAAASGAVAEAADELAAAANGTGTADDAAGDGEEDDDVSVRFGRDLASCHEAAERFGGGFLISARKLHDLCERSTEDGFLVDVAEDLRDRLPGAVFFFLPLIALVLKLLYPLSRRYYVEHLLFIVHVQAFLFLVLIVNTLLEYAETLLPWLKWPELLLSIAFVLYVPYYLYRAMRRVYRQGRWVTTAKYLVLVNAYVVAAGLVFLGAAVLSILSV